MILTVIKDFFVSKKRIPDSFEKEFTLLGTYNVSILIKKWSLDEYTLFIIFKNASKTDIAQSPVKFVEEFFMPVLDVFFRKLDINIIEEKIEIDCKERKDLYIMITINEKEKEVIERNITYLEKVIGEVVVRWREGLIF
ncbi:MAG: hypothetical protein DSY47_06300 [Hydrogenothermus sp.]|nr:MAG: hypothetical protein DSY47_06300 [Hydrogenothermus sp.]